MARTKSKTKHAKVALARLMDDDVQKQLRTATKRVREAAHSLSGASKSLRRKPSPKLDSRRAAIGAAVAGGAALALKKRRSGSGTPEFTQVPVTEAQSGPVPAPTPPTPVSAA